MLVDKIFCSGIKWHTNKQFCQQCVGGGEVLEEGALSSIDDNDSDEVSLMLPL